MTGSKTPKKHGGKPFAPGDERINRGGRPPVALCLTDTLRADALALAEMRVGKRTIRGENVRLVSQRLWALARAGNTAAIKILYDRCDGLPKATVDLHDDNSHITITTRIIGSDGKLKKETEQTVPVAPGFKGHLAAAANIEVVDV